MQLTQRFPIDIHGMYRIQLDLDAARMGYISYPDVGPISGRRKCWQHGSGRSVIVVAFEFGNTAL